MGVVVVLVAGGIFFWRAWESAPAATGYTMRQITSDSGLATTPAISPDGRLIAFASDRQTAGNLDIWVQPLTAGARPIRLTTDAADDLAPSFSPDGGAIVFFSKRDGGGIYIIPALGGEERLLAKGQDRLQRLSALFSRREVDRLFDWPRPDGFAGDDRARGRRNAESAGA